MFHLANMLRELPDTTVTTYNWNSWPDAYRAILTNQGKAKIVVIGYSGGGSRATWLANMPSKPQIDLMVYYDPSPRWQMKPISANVKRALCYHNTNPMMWVPGIGTLGAVSLLPARPQRQAMSLPGPRSKPSTSPSSIFSCRSTNRSISALWTQCGRWSARPRRGRRRI